MLLLQWGDIVWHACKPKSICISTYDGIKGGSALVMQAM